MLKTGWFEVVRESLNVTGDSTIRQSAYEFLLAFHSNCPYLAPLLRYSEILAEHHHFNIPHLYLVPPLGVTALQICQYLWYQKTKVPMQQPGTLIDVVCMILGLVVLVELYTHDDSMIAQHCTVIGTNKTFIYSRYHLLGYTDKLLLIILSILLALPTATMQ